MTMCLVDGVTEDGQVEVTYMREYRSYLVPGSQESEEPLDNVLKILPPVVLDSKRGFLQILPEEEVRAELYFRK